MTDPILSVQNLVKHYPLRRGVVFKRTFGQVQALDDVSFDLHEGETLGLVGESGCGKSTLAKVLMCLEQATSGAAFYQGEDLFTMDRPRMREVRQDIQIILQDPYSSLNPRMTVGDIVGEPFEIHSHVVRPEGRRAQVQELLELVGLDPDHVNRYPHQFSGGQRQRIGIARGLALRPRIVICDEPVSALDVSVQAQVVNLLEELQAEFNLSYIFIAHDLSVVRHISDRVAVMYLGRIVEIGTEEEIYRQPAHPYTQALLSAVPSPDPAVRGIGRRIVLSGDVPSPADPPSGCRFRSRCFKAQDKCTHDDPELRPRATAHPDACHFSETLNVLDK